MKNRIAIILTFSSFVMMVWRCGVGTSPPLETGQIVPLGHPWKLTVPHQEVPEGLTSLSAASCGSCHAQHYEEWKTSTHAHAWTDLQFQAELKKESSPIMCINCHIPLQNQQEFIVHGLIDGDIYRPATEKNPHFDRALQQEGINCASCHVRNGAVIGPNGTEKAPHRTRKDTVHLSEQLCISCHNADAVVTPTLACSFQTGEEWETGPYFGKKNCKSCHMEETHREIMVGYGERKSRFHTFAGSGIPKRTGDHSPMLNGLEFYPQEVIGQYRRGDRLNYTLKVKNEHAGHRVPTGDPERFFIIRFELFDGIDSLVSVQEYRIGEEWQWHPEAKKISDNNFDPGEERAYLFDPIFQTSGAHKLHISVTKHRMSQATARYNKLGKDYPLFIQVFEKEITVKVDQVFGLRVMGQ